jgi:hypothetical protein
MTGTEIACGVRLFQLHRDTDVSGFSSAGVADLLEGGAAWTAA